VQVNRVVRRIQEVNEELQEARQKAISAARLAAVGEMSTGLAHELRNPMTSVKLLIQNAVERHGGALNERQAEVVVEELRRMERIIEQLLDFTRPARMAPVRQDLCREIDRALAFAREQAQRAGVDVKFDCGGSPLEVDLDSDRFRQVLVNLFQNALEAMPAGGTILIEAAGAGDQAEVRVTDTGPGIAEPVLRRLFEPFVTDKARGTGLGLAISKRIIEEHGGTLEGANKLEGGAIFTIRLPRGGGSNSKPMIDQNAERRIAEDRPSPELAHAQIAGR
jgi:signal transduction histidine kinase